MEQLDDHKYHPSHKNNNQRLCDEQEHLPISLNDSKWKLRHQHDQKLSMEKSLHCRTKVRLKRLKINPKGKACEHQSQEFRL